MTLRVPEHFSLVEHPEETLLFLAELSAHTAQNRNVILDLRGVLVLTPDAIAVLVARLKDRQFTHGMGISGNEPDDPGLRALFVDSGFYEFVTRTGTPGTSAGAGKIKRKRSNVVESRSAKALKDFASNSLSGSPQKWFAVQRTLVECMSNTKAHAGDPSVATPWWACVYADPARRVAQFSFVDTGVGIFKSVKVRGLQGVLRALGITDNSPQILRRLVYGQIESSTGKRYRGKGIPEMRIDLLDRKELDRLVIISNNVYADVGADKFVELQTEFRGTFVYFEKRPS